MMGGAKREAAKLSSCCRGLVAQHRCCIRRLEIRVSRTYAHSRVHTRTYSILHGICVQYVGAARALGALAMGGDRRGGETSAPSSARAPRPLGRSRSRANADVELTQPTAPLSATGLQGISGNSFPPHPPLSAHPLGLPAASSTSTQYTEAGICGASASRPACRVRIANLNSQSIAARRSLFSSHVPRAGRLCSRREQTSRASGGTETASETAPI